MPQDRQDPAGIKASIERTLFLQNNKVMVDRAEDHAFSIWTTSEDARLNTQRDQGNTYCGGELNVPNVSATDLDLEPLFERLPASCKREYA